jgi:hypothetical protein
MRHKLADARSDARRDGVRVVQHHTRGANYADTRWSRFEICAANQIAPRGLRQHADTRQHKLAIRVYFAPDVALQVLESCSMDSHMELFRGGVPQVEDWLRAWRACRTPQSFAAAEANGITDNFIKGSRVAGANRKAFRAMIRIMALVLRAHKLRRCRLRKASPSSWMTVDLSDLCPSGVAWTSRCSGVPVLKVMSFPDAWPSCAEGEISQTRCSRRLTKITAGKCRKASSVDFDVSHNVQGDASQTLHWWLTFARKFASQSRMEEVLCKSA